MRRSWNIPGWYRRSGARWLGVFMALIYFAASLGALPSPRNLASMGLIERVSGERFPCEGCLCGCATADQCWSACCCHSIAERWAWAQANDVQPPESFLAKVRIAGLGDDGAPKCPLCEADDKSANGQTAGLTPTLSPLACKGMSGWLALASLIGLVGSGPLLPPTPCAIAKPGEPGPEPTVAPLESPTPPPRF